MKLSMDGVVIVSTLESVDPSIRNFMLVMGLAVLMFGNKQFYQNPLKTFFKSLEAVWQKTINKFKVYLKLQLSFLALIAGIPPREPAKQLVFFQDSF